MQYFSIYRYFAGRFKMKKSIATCILTLNALFVVI